jgi:uridine kinase
MTVNLENRVPVVLVCGGSCSGKSSFAQLFANGLVLSMDHFYYGKSKMKAESDGSYNFDAPESVNIAECAEAIAKLSERISVEIPVYDMKISERVGVQTISVKPETQFIIVEGIFSFHSPLREIATMKIFLDTPTEVRVARRMLRDVEKGRSDIETLSWSITVEKNHAKYIEPMKKYADLAIPFSYNPVKLDG